MKRLVCVIEGKGEVEALPALCNRVLTHLGRGDWRATGPSVRIPRGRLVDQRKPGPLRGCLQSGVDQASKYARAKRADAVLFLYDADDDCPVVWAKDLLEKSTLMRTAAVMAVREYESWLLANQPAESLTRANIKNPEGIPDAKGRLRRIVIGYKPTTHQLALTREIDIERVRSRSRSFDKLVRSLADLCQ